MSKTVALIRARGNGSTLHRKNTYPILGRPVIDYAFETLTKADFIDHVYVWTEDKQIAEIAEKAGVIPLERPRSMIHYHGGFHTEFEFIHNSLDQIKEHLGGTFSTMVNFNCNNILFKTSTLNEMHRKVMEDTEARSIVSISPVKPNLCIDNPGYGLFPFMTDENVSPEEMPRIFRRGGVSIGKYGLEVAALNKKLYHEVDAVEGFDFQAKSDIDFAEFHLLKRQGAL